MQGIRIRSMYGRTGADGRRGTRRDYELADVVARLRPHIAGLNWLLDNVTPMHTAPDGSTFDDYQDRFDDLFVWERDDLRLATQDFIPTYATFLPGDWDVIIGLDTPLPEHNVVGSDRTVLTAQAVIIFMCVDALWWEVYSRDDRLLSAVAKGCTLCDWVELTTSPEPARPN